MIGQIVQEVKANVSNDFCEAVGHDCPMAGWTREKEFNEAFIARVKRLREQHNGWTSEQMAKALGIPAERYRKYEYRSVLPHYLIEPFAMIVGRDVAYVLTGRSAKAARHAPRRIVHHANAA